MEETLALLGATRDGLASDEARRRLDHFGANALPRAAREGAFAVFIRQLRNPLLYVLLASAALAFGLGKGTDGAVVLGVVLVNTLIGFAQEHRAGRAIDALLDLVPETATALRGGARVALAAAELVPGDLVLLQSGDKVPADVRLLAVKSLAVDEAALTGESVPARKETAPAPEDAALGDRRSMAYSGTLVTYGTATGVVVVTGGGTELGRISALLRETTKVETPLTRSLEALGRWLTAGIVLLAAALFGVGLARGYPLVDAVLVGVTLAVAAIPEGLPAVITISLAVGVQRMAARRAIVRKLPAVETLGQATVICSDKTGTLTRNEMTVRALWAGGERFEVSGAGYAPVGALSREGAPAALSPAAREALLAGALCNDARLVARDGAPAVDGDPTEGALAVAAEKLGVAVDESRARFPRRDEIPFESERRFMATLHAAPEGGSVVYVKGAPEAIFRRATSLFGGGLDGGPLDVDALHAEVERMATGGMRVLALAKKELAAPTGELSEGEIESGLVLLGLAGLLDPPREEAIAAVAACRRAGIAVKMITGDHRATAEAVGAALGLDGAGGRRGVTGRELAALSSEELAASARDVSVFARVEPEHKLLLVRTLQAQGHVVAMTGDGVNDAPALKQADIGVAMGITGTAAAKEAADVVLTDDNFATIAAAVEEGRRVFDNLVKALAFTLPTNLGEALILLVAVLSFPTVAGAPLMPILPIQILWINLVATVALALPLAFEAKEPNLMSRPPRPPGAPILSRFVVVRTLVVTLLMTAGAVALFLYEYRGETARGTPHAVALAEAQTMAVTTVVLFQVFYVLNCRSLNDSIFRIGFFGNRWVFAGIGLLLALQVGFVHLPFFNRLFGSAPLALDAWLTSALAGAVVLPVITFEKWWRRRTGDAA